MNEDPVEPPPDPNEVEAAETPAESDVEGVGPESGGLAAEGLPEYPSERLYIVREANELVELHKALAAARLEIKEDQ